MLLLTGPQGFGKTHRLMSRVRELLAAGQADLRLLVPTATMAEHRRNELAREGFVLRPTLATTLASFANSWLQDVPQIAGAQLALLVEKSLDALSPAEFRSVRAFPGFRSSLQALIEELSSAGLGAAEVRAAIEQRPGRWPEGPAFLTIFEHVESEWKRLGMLGRGERLRLAATRIREKGLPDLRTVFIDGFFTLSEPELWIVDALRAHAGVTISLPSWDGAATARAALLQMGFEEERGLEDGPETRKIILAARTMEEEIGEIVRRVLSEAAAGRSFREMGIVVRSADPYVPALRAALERFGIPARFYFSEPLAGHSVVRYLSAAVKAMLKGWDHEDTLAVMRMASSGAGRLPEMDRFDFEVREHLPGSGLHALRGFARHPAIRRLIDALGYLDSWRAGERTPDDWAGELNRLGELLFHFQEPREPFTPAMVAVWRSQSHALRAFGEAVEDAGKALEADVAVPFDTFWHALKEALGQTQLQAEDRRRNVVHVMDVFEARQWELPVIFLCGLLERQFPQYHPQNPILPDQARAVFREAGISLRTSAERDAEEPFLFRFACSRATSTLVLSYPRFNEKGDENLCSSFLEELAATLVAEPSRPVRPAAAVPFPAARVPSIRDAQLRERIDAKNAKTSPSAIDCFLQCAFQFFGRRTLGLKEPPASPGERLDLLAQGDVVHRVLARCVGAGENVDDVFEQEFRRICAERRIPDGYRTEAVRLDLLRDLRRFISECDLPPAKHLLEKPFELELPDGVVLRGRFDRVDIYPDDRALIVDYKYSRGANLRDRFKKTDEAKSVQGGLYLLGLKRSLGHEPAGMLFAGLRGEASWRGWHVSVPGLRHGKRCADEDLGGLVSKATQAFETALGKIRRGRILPEPEDDKLCEWCEYCDICRVESAAWSAAAGGLEEAEG